jgi:pyridinium-3,5-bisthiocarboxylic acid mononucleotide nickel chelatase
MHLGAMIDLGVPKEYLISELGKLGLNEFKLNIKRANRKGIEGTLVDVMITRPDAGVNQHFASGTHNHESHRNFTEIKNLISNSSLNTQIKEYSISIFEKIALAEGKIHGLPLDKVHFHEVGAVDSIVDIVGAAICMDYFKPDLIMAAPPELGSGMVKCQHGIFPVPAPATAEILTGIPVRTGGVNHEATTPTGAAILATFVKEFTYKTEFIIQKSAYGIGFRDTDQVPNVLRVILATQNNNHEHEKATIIECNIDDMNPEHYDYIITKLFELGADDVFLSPIIMKKNRPAITLSILSKPELTSNLVQLIFEETTTLGLRQYEVVKSVLERKIVNLETPWGIVRVKQAMDRDRVVKSKPEYEDCTKIAREQQIPLREVIDKIDQLLRIHSGSTLNHDSQ